MVTALRRTQQNFIDTSYRVLRECLSLMDATGKSPVKTTIEVSRHTLCFSRQKTLNTRTTWYRSEKGLTEAHTGLRSSSYLRVGVSEVTSFCCLWTLIYEVVNKLKQAGSLPVFHLANHAFHIVYDPRTSAKHSNQLVFEPSRVVQSGWRGGVISRRAWKKSRRPVQHKKICTWPNYFGFAFKIDQLNLMIMC